MTSPTLREELKKKGPFDSLEQEACLNILRTHSVLAVQFDRLFREHDISSPQYNILRILRGHGGRGLPSLEIASQMIAAVPDITRLIDRLEKAGYVKRERSQADRRVVNVSITGAGLRFLKRLDEPVRQSERSAVSHLSRKDLSDIIRLMTKIRQRPA